MSHFPKDILEPLTVKKLKQYLKEMEDAWTEQDEEFLGKFENQLITCAGVGQGYSPAGVSFAYADIMFIALE